MADTAAPAQPQQGSSSFGFLTRKLGPLPIWAWGALAVGAWYWYTHYGPGAAKAAAAKAPQQQRPRVVVVDERGKPVPAAPAGPPGGRHRPPAPRRAASPPAAQPQVAAAPMTAGDVYGTLPTATMEGSTYDSGIPADAMEGAYVAAG
jgi:hypothetical protein